MTASTGLADFIRSDFDAILLEWNEFAQTVSHGQNIHVDARRDYAAGLLLAIAQDMGRPQSPDAQEAKGKGLAPRPRADLADAACSHAVARVMAHNSLPELIAEFRALRASVLRRWSAHHSGDHQLDQVSRFNEAVDEALSASVDSFHTKLEASRDLILGVLAHDLRSPLHAAALSTDLILNSGSTDASCLKAALITQRSTKRMSQLIDDLLDYARTRFGDGLPLNVEMCDMNAVCNEAVDEAHAAHPGRAVSCDFASHGHGEWDPARIKQLLSNLLVNALQHGDRHSPVHVKLRTTTDQVEIAVHNGGPPIPLSMQTNVFQLLHVGKGHRSEKTSAGSSGLNLGLYIAHLIAVAHGGDIGFVSSEDEGTTFTVSLPRK